MSEKWLPVSGCGLHFAERYEVSDLGRVRVRLDAAPAKNLHLGKIRATYLCPKGYEYVALCVARELKTIAVHRLVGKTFLGMPTEGMQLNHIDGNKLNNCLSNLEYVSSKVNNRHSWDVIRKKSKAVINGESMTLAEAVERFAVPGLTYTAVDQRLRVLGWSLERALTADPVVGRSGQKASAQEKKNRSDAMKLAWARRREEKPLVWPTLEPERLEKP